MLRIPVFRAVANLIKFQSHFVCKMKQYIDMKCFLKICHTKVLIILKEQLCDSVKVRLRILITTHVRKPAISCNTEKSHYWGLLVVSQIVYTVALN